MHSTKVTIKKCVSECAHSKSQH